MVNPDGRFPLVLVCDHASNAVPAALKQLSLGQGNWPGTSPGYRRGRRHPTTGGAVGRTGGVVRLLAAGDRLQPSPRRSTSIAELSDGTFVPGNRALSDAAVEARVNGYSGPIIRRSPRCWHSTGGTVMAGHRR